MHSGRIAPIVRQFFSGATQTKRSSDTNADGGGQREAPEREPGRDEAQAALELLQQQEDFRKQGLTAQILLVDGRIAIQVCNAAGTQLRLIRGMEILRLLAGNGGQGAATTGRILDRRI